MAETVIQHVLCRLKEIGVDDIFGVAGDYAFPVNDAIVEHPAINWIGCCNELNASYAADGYARMRGVGAVCTTYGVGELAAMSAIAGSYAEILRFFIWWARPTCRRRRGGRWCTTRWATGNSTCSAGWRNRWCAQVRHDAAKRGGGDRTTHRRGALPSTARLPGVSQRRREHACARGRAIADRRPAILGRWLRRPTRWPLR